MKISVVGLGKLGACTATCFALGGYDVLGMDLNEDSVNKINNKIAPVDEYDLEDAMEQIDEGSLEATTSYKRVVEETDVTFIIVPTPSKNDHTFSTYIVEDVLKHLIMHLGEVEKLKHLFVIVSTVMPGTIEELKRKSDFWWDITKGRELHYGRDYSFTYNPEFIAIGSVIQNFMNPDVVLIGSDNETDALIVEQIYQETCENEPYFSKVSLEEAEITKLALNTYITMKISYANLLSNICEKFNANVDNVTEAIGKDKRVSPNYFRGGLSYGGPCFPRDTKAFDALLQSIKLPNALPVSVDEINNFQIDKIVKEVYNGSVAILGLSYKPGTPIIEDSPSIWLIKKLIDKDCNIIAFDPDSIAVKATRGIFGGEITYASTVAQCFESASTIVIAVPDERYKEIKPVMFKSIIDPWRILK